MKQSQIPDDEAYLGELWRRFKMGDEEAFDKMTRLRYRLLYNYGTRFTKDYELIKDCIQDLFLDLWHSRSRVVDTTYVTIYLIRSLRNNLLRKLRINRRIDFSSDIETTIDHFTDHVNVESVLISSEVVSFKAKRIRVAIGKLPKRQQEVIFLKFYEGLPIEQIAEVMEVERQTVSNFVHRAITQLREDLPTLIFSIFPFFYCGR
jgi:RNA polymerase sigma factor (sigma-70 family)